VRKINAHERITSARVVKIYRHFRDNALIMDWRRFVRSFGLYRSHPALPYGIGVTCFLAGTLLRILLSPLFGAKGAPYLAYFLPILFSAWIAGLRGGLTTTAIAAIAARTVFWPTSFAKPEDYVLQQTAFIIFTLEGVIISALGQAQLAARARAESNAKAAAHSANIAHERSNALAESEERLRLAVDGAQIGTWHYHISTGKITWSDTMKANMGRPGYDPGEVELGFEVVHPDDRERVHQALTDSVQTGADFDFEVRILWPDNSVRWSVIRGRTYRDDNDVPVRIEGIAIDITDRKLAEEDAEARAKTSDALNSIGRAIRETRSTMDVQDIALAELAETLGADRCLVILIDEQRDVVNLVSEWHRPMLSDLRGVYTLSTFGVDLDELFPNSTTLVVPHVQNGMLSPLTVAMLLSLQIASVIVVPISISGQIVGMLGVCMAETERDWTLEEVSFVEGVAAQLRVATESARLLNDAQNRASREALINRISEVMRTSLDPDVIQASAVNMLGDALHADRCYFAMYDLENSEITITRDWHGQGLNSIRGVHAFPNVPEMFYELYSIGSTSIISDRDSSTLSAQTVENMKKLELRSRLSVAVADTAGMATLTVAMAESARDWLPDEIELIEKVASLLRSGIEMARVQQREHRIATDLQAALLPPLPDLIAGLQIGSCMQPAMDEAEIGGDFFDVFNLDKNLCAIVVGDVSGKGLAAAGQLAMVRNSLRTSLYVHPTPSTALTALNTIITVHELLNGFVTMFVGIYDAAKGVLSYSSCGHVPALLRRASDGSVEILKSRGLPLGVAESADVAEDAVSLNIGDTLLLYTDGLSEAGPSRAEMIETEGLIKILEAIPATRNAPQSAKSVLNEVTTFANGVLRDDVCVLVVKRQPEV
jgi:PAS domain S-box-containing protein